MVISPVQLQRGPAAAIDPNLNPKPNPAAELHNPHGLSPLELPENVPLFGTDGIRGRVGDILNVSLALHAGYWSGRVLQATAGRSGPVILGQDSRLSGEMLGAALAAGLTAAGVEVWNLGLCPTPCVAYLTQHTEAIGGAMISASHNPPEDNGIKFFGASGLKLSKDIQKQIDTAIRWHVLPPNSPSLPSASWGRHFLRSELVRDYELSLTQTLAAEGLGGHRPLNGLKIVLDTAWGAAVRVAPSVFEELGAEVILLHGEPDGSRINVNCGSTHLATLAATVQASGADMGFGFDGDADRVLAVDGQGRTIDGDYILYLWGSKLRALGKLPQDTIVSTVMANLGFERAWQASGGRLVRTAVGDQYVQAAMLEGGAMLGGEQSGHILCQHYSATGDGTLAALHLAALTKASGQSLGQLMDASFHTYPQVLKNVRVVDRDRRLNWQECEPLVGAIARAEAAMGDAGRVLVRASGTEPVIRVMVEAATAELVNHWCDRLVAAVETHLV